MTRDFLEIRNELDLIEAELATATDLQAVASKYVGRGGKVDSILARFRDMAPSERVKVGERLNRIAALFREES